MKVRISINLVDNQLQTKPIHQISIMNLFREKVDFLRTSINEIQEHAEYDVNHKAF